VLFIQIVSIRLKKISTASPTPFLFRNISLHHQVQVHFQLFLRNYMQFECPILNYQLKCIKHFAK